MRTTNDPITGVRDRLVSHGFATEADLKELDRKARAEVDEAVEWAKASPEPPVSELFSQVYIKGTETPTLRGRDLSETHHF